MKRIVVTGASGVVGNAILEKAAGRDDVEIFALSRSTELPESAGNISWANTDYSEESLMPLLSGTDAVVHLAGIKGTKTELYEYDEDMRMAEALLKAAAANRVGTFIYASSRLVYGDPEKVPWTEDTEPDPRSAYGKNKLRCEELCRRYSEEYGLRTVILRIAQVLSEKDHMRNMVNVFRDRAEKKQHLTVIGKSAARRQYIYSRDLADIIYSLIPAGGSGCCVVNAGMEGAYTNLEIAESFGRAYGIPEPVNYDDSAPETITPSYMDVSLMKELTGYVPREMDEVLSDMAARQS